MPIALTWRTSAAVAPNPSRSRTCNTCRSDARSAAPAVKGAAGRNRTNKIPAMAGIHLSYGPTAEEWVPAIAGSWFGQTTELIIEGVGSELRCSFYTATPGGHPRVDVIPL